MRLNELLNLPGRGLLFLASWVCAQCGPKTQSAHVREPDRLCNTRWFVLTRFLIHFLKAECVSDGLSRHLQNVSVKEKSVALPLH